MHGPHGVERDAHGLDVGVAPGGDGESELFFPPQQHHVHALRLAFGQLHAHSGEGHARSAEWHALRGEGMHAVESGTHSEERACTQWRVAYTQ